MRQLIKVIVYPIILLLLGACVYVSFRHYRGDQLLSVQTGSMVPTFYPGDAVITHKTTLQNLEVGDVVAYRNPNDTKVIVSHRLIDVDYATGKLITEGDAVSLQDLPFPASLVVGKVNIVVPKFGHAINWLHKPIDLIVMVYTPAAIILVSEAKRLSKQYTKPYYQLYSYGLNKR
jgi:signal peptidase I